MPTCSKTTSGASPSTLRTRLGELARDGEARLLLLGRLAAAAHHPGEVAAVDEAARAELLDQRALLGRGHDADALGAGGGAQLGGEDAEAAGGAPDQHAVAGLQLHPVDQHAVGGEVGQAVGGGLLPREVLRLGQQLLGLDLRELGERAPARLVAPDPLRRRRQRVEAVDLGVLVGGLVAVDDDLVAELPARHARADLPHDAGGVRAADVVVLVGVVAEDRDRLAERRPHVVEVHAGGHHAHDHLERAGLGNLDLLDLEGVDGLALALLADDPRGHRLGQLARLCVDVCDLGQINGHLEFRSLLALCHVAAPGGVGADGTLLAVAVQVTRPPQPHPEHDHGADGPADAPDEKAVSESMWSTSQPKFWPKKPVMIVRGRRSSRARSPASRLR